MEKLNLKELIRDYKDFAIPILVTVASFIAAAVIIYPQVNQYLINKQEISQTVSKLEALDQKAQKLQALDANDIKTKADLTIAALPEDPDYLGIIGIVQSVVSQAGFTITDFSLGQSGAGTGNASSYPIKLEVTGSRDALPLLLNRLESAPRVMKVANLEISSAASSGPTSVSLSVTVFYSPIPKALGAVESPLPELTLEDNDLVASLTRNSPISTSSGTAVAASSLPRGKTNPFE